MTEEVAATPGWVAERLDEIFASYPAGDQLQAARRAYADCLASRKEPGAPSDLLGAEFTECRNALTRALGAAGVAVGPLAPALEALEAEIAAGS